MDTIEEPMDSFQSRLRTAMQMRNMSVSTLSSKSGISQNTIYIYLNPEKYHRESCPGSNNLEALAVALDVSMDWLWGRQVALMSWIPCSERLPEEEIEVLVTRKFLGCKDGSHGRNNHIPPSAYVEVAQYSYGEWEALSDEYKIARNRHTNPIAWMPLPTPYGKETT